MTETKECWNEFIQMIRGWPFPKDPFFQKKNIEDFMDYVPKDGDVIISSYPKAGTNWVQYIVLQIVSKGEWFPAFNDTAKVVPFIEMSGIDAVEAIQHKPRIYKHHIPYNMVQKNGKAKYIYIYRNPEDTVVSFYHFMKNMQMEGSEQVDFDQFFDSFVTGNIGYGNCFEQVLSYYERRGSEGLLMVSYEDLQAKRRDSILRIAKFLGDEYHQCLLENDYVMNKVIEHTSFEYMKKNLHLIHPFKKDEETGGDIKVNFFRKGIVGDGKNVLTPDQRTRLEEAARKILTGTTIIEEWYTSKFGEKYKSDDCVQLIRGCTFPLLEWFSKKNIEDAMDYVPKDGDVIIASYPKTGTTWLQYIVLQIISRGESFPSFDDVLYKIMPFLEMSGIAAVDALESRPRLYKHHMAYNMVQKNDKAKYIYIHRNPEDVVVSFYHFMKGFQLESYNQVDFDTFVEDFITGNLGYGNYFQHLSSYYRHRNDKNLLMISYEKLHANRRDGILKIAKFLGKEHHQSLLNEDDILKLIIEHTAFDYMKKNLYLTHPAKKEEKDSKVEFFRKGIIGDGKVTLSNDQRKLIREEALKVLNGTSIIQEWYPELCTKV